MRRSRGTDARRALPSWDAVRRELRLGDVVVKRFREPAANQEAILAAFEEEGWCEHVFDPLPGGLQPAAAKRRLHDTIKRLNRFHLHSMIRFHGNGRGTGIFWEFNSGGSDGGEPS